MNPADALQAQILAYTSLIRAFDAALTAAHGLTVAPLRAAKSGLIPVKGLLEWEGRTWRYHFHGIGCHVQCDGLVVDFDYSLPAMQYVRFEVRKLRLYLDSTLPEGDVLRDPPGFDAALRALLRQGKLVPKGCADGGTHEFEVLGSA